MRAIARLDLQPPASKEGGGVKDGGKGAGRRPGGGSGGEGGLEGADDDMSLIDDENPGALAANEEQVWSALQGAITVLRSEILER